MQLNPRLKHVDEGAVSISLNGDEVAIALGRAVPLNSTHQVWSGAAVCDKPDVMLRHMRVTCLLVSIGNLPISHVLGKPSSAAHFKLPFSAPRICPGSFPQGKCFLQVTETATPRVIIVLLCALRVRAWRAQVVGSVHKGHEVLKLMSGQQTNHFDAPVQKILVSDTLGKERERPRGSQSKPCLL